MLACPKCGGKAVQPIMDIYCVTDCGKVAGVNQIKWPAFDHVRNLSGYFHHFHHENNTYVIAYTVIPQFRDNLMWFSPHGGKNSIPQAVRDHLDKFAPIAPARLKDMEETNDKMIVVKIPGIREFDTE